MNLAWQEQLEQPLKYERNLNFSAVPGVHEDELNAQKRKVARDPMSHRIIEKRRRDRMNNCLADLSNMIPSNYLKKQGRGRIEKTEIIEMAIKHLKQLQAQQCKGANGCPAGTEEAAQLEHYRLGYQECLSETMHFLVETQVCYPGDPLCVRIMNHLQKHRERVVKGRQSHGPFQSYSHLDSKRDCTSPDGSAVSRASPISRPTSQNGFCQVQLVPKIEENLRGPVDGSDVHMTDMQGEAVDRADDPCLRPVAGGECSSQLREMLQNPLLHLEQRGRSLSGSSRPISTASSSSSTKGDEVYKFKTNIKQRFRADQRGTKPMDGGGEEAKIAETESCHSSRTASQDERRHSDTPFSMQSNAHAASRTLDSAFSSASINKSYSTNSLESSLRSGSSLGSLISEAVFGGISPSHFRMLPVNHPHAETKPNPLVPPPSFHPRPEDSVHPNLVSPDVAVFALHPKGSFYVPLTVDAALLAPGLDAVPEVVPTVLHHVAIAVYFSRAAAEATPRTTTSMHPSSFASLAQEPMQQVHSSSRLWSPLAVVP